jgi:hypothetical protein
MLQGLLTEDDALSKAFRKHIRSFNNAFAFASLGVNIDQSVTYTSGPFAFRIQGVLCHKMGSLRPSEGEPTKFAQIYIHDGNSEQAIDRRMTVAHLGNPIHRQIFQQLQDMLHQCNPYVHVFLQAFQVIDAKPPHERHNISAHLTVNSNADPRTHNLPTTEEVAVILPSGAEEGVSKDLIVRYQDGRLFELNDCNSMYQPLLYVLLFPRGETGWHPEIPHTSELPEGRTTQGKKVTRTQYYAYRLFQRIGEALTILLGGPLLQQYAVDAWALTEQSKLMWVCHHQFELHAHHYRGLADAVRAGDTNLDQHGVCVILPSSHLGSTRHMYQLFQDSMAICRYYHHPDIFLTFTANPNWPEIKAALGPHQTASDRPDIVTCVFELKKKALLHNLTKSNVLGKAVAQVWTIEFQKRGLPHMHLLLFFTTEDKIRSPEDFRFMIRADIPDPHTEPELHAIVTSSMIHQCGPRCQNTDGKCTKGFPKPFRNDVSMSENGYPQYARPDNGRFIEKNGRRFTNQHIVPYCPYLSLKFDAHINCEVCASVKSVKYIHKYIYKGHDCTTMILGDGDEVKQYLDSQYLAANEACHRLFQFHMHHEYPSVYRLPIHLPNEQSVVYRPDVDPAVFARQLQRSQNTELTQYFKANAENLGGNATSFTYQEFPHHFVWHDDEQKWQPRSQGTCIGRMYAIPPTAGEKFYL